MSKKEILLINAFSSAAMYVDEIIEEKYKCILVNLLTDNEELNKSLKQMTYKRYKTYSKDCLETFVLDKDPNLILDFASKRNIVAVIPGNDSSTSIVEFVINSLGLIGNDSNTTSKRIIKSCMQKACKKAGIRSIETSIIKTKKDIIDFFNNHSVNKAFLKFDYGASCIAAKLVNNATEALKHYNIMLQTENSFADKNVNIVIQEYIDGDEYVVNTLSVDGRHYLTDFWMYKKIPTSYGNYIDYSVMLIERIDKKLQDIVDYCFKALDAVEMKYGVAHNEIKVDKKGPVLIEINPRPMGAGQTREFQKQVFGHCVVNLGLQCYLGKKDFYNNLYPIVEYKPLMHARHKLGFIFKEIYGTLMSADLILKKLKTFNSVFYYQTLKYNNFTPTSNLENTSYSVKLVSESLEDLEYDFDLLCQLEKDFPKLMICQNDEVLNSINFLLENLEHTNLEIFKKENKILIENLPYKYKGFNFICKVLRLL